MDDKKIDSLIAELLGVDKGGAQTICYSNNSHIGAQEQVIKTASGYIDKPSDRYSDANRPQVVKVDDYHHRSNAQVIISGIVIVIAIILLIVMASQ